MGKSIFENFAQKHSPEPLGFEKNTVGETPPPEYGVVPKDWATMFGVDKAKNPNFFSSNFTTFEAYSPPEVQYWMNALSEPYIFSKSDLLGSYAIYLPATPLIETIQHTYGSGSTYDMAMGAFKSALAGVGNAAMSFKSSGQKGVLYDAPKIYEESTRRTFDVQIDLSAYDDMDKDIYNVISFFRRFSYPKRIGHYLGRIEMPAVFKIHGGVWSTFQSAENFYIIENMSVTYGDKIKLMKYGMPMQAGMTIKFTEILPATRERFSQAKVKYGIVTKNVIDAEENRKNELAEIQKQNSDVLMRVTGAPSVKDHEYEVKNIMIMGIPGGGVKTEGAPTANERQEEIDSKTWYERVPKQTDDITTIKATGGTVEGAPDPARNNFDIKKMAETGSPLTNKLVTRALNNATQIAMKQAESKVKEIIQNSSIAKRLNAALDIDPRHRVEIKAKMKKIKYAKYVV